ncbi:uncharacterized protein LOC106136585 [Amyelois transitella]|uniref:uncharacterized protein LOC106136585 n=1 Tax=Amyelois transitella TaxID=680683 RepID=UPI00298FF2B1|nr:uncharacterized protein LOC106136585 [Amyelois transitella]
MQAAPTRYVSVSELYSTDEVELLLDEIRELEPTSCRGEDVQDFEIAGSGCSGAGGRSPAELTERSWDSHAHYRRAPPARARPLAPLYCRARLLATRSGAATLLLLLVCASICGCVWSAVGMRIALLPLASRVQLLLLGALSSLLLHGVMLSMHVSGLAALLPIHWDRLSGVTSLWSVFALLVGGLLTLYSVAFCSEYARAPAPLRALLLAGAALGLLGAALAAALAALALPAAARAPPAAAYRAVPPVPADHVL